MAHVVSFGNSAQVFGYPDPTPGLTTADFLVKFAPVTYEPVWDVNLNGGNDYLLLNGMGRTFTTPMSFIIFGGNGNDTLGGGPLDDTLNGGSGADVYYESDGNDTYVVDSILDRVSQYEVVFDETGTDSIFATCDYAIPPNIENLTLAGGLALNGWGNIYSNTLIGNAGDNTLDGLQGADTMMGGAGNDVFVVDSRADQVIETSNQGIDSVETSVSHVLSANVEQGFLNSPGRNHNLTGNTLSNLLVGNAGKNSLSGLDNADELRGEGGSDQLSGGAGTDTLYGGTGADLFVFVDVTESDSQNRDLIRDFESGLDRIDLRQLDAGAAPGDQALTFIGDLAFDAAGQVRVTTTATSTRIEVSVDADTDAEMLILLNGVHSLTAADFVL